MKFVSWNVNGLRACVKKGFMDFFENCEADFVCLQEIKMLKEQADFEFPDHYEYWYSAEKKGYSGTAIFAKHKAISESYGIGIDEHDHEGRVITLEYEGFYLVNVYTPNSKDALQRLEYRKHWEDDFRAYLLALDKKKPVIMCGDLNVAHREIDLKHPKANVKHAGFTPDEREKIDTLLKSGFIDSFRYLHPDEIKYSWWSYRASARKNNAGWRIDYFILSERIKDKLSSAEIHNDVFGSDHCPISIQIDM